MSEKDNMQLWLGVEETDPNHAKEFKRGGGFKGTATNATWQAKRATEKFGPYGKGWGMEIVSEKYVKGHALKCGTKAVVHVILAKFWYILDGERYGVLQYGQTMFVGENKYGAYTDEEAPKKSLTDAMLKAMSLLGFSADIHMGLYDDNKYIAKLRKKYDEPEAPEPEPVKFADAKKALLGRISKKIATASSSLTAKAFFEKVESGRNITCTLPEHLDTITKALMDGKYDWATGDKIPSTQENPEQNA